MKTDSKTIQKALDHFGFSKNEAAVYLFLLKSLEATAFEIAKETGIPRTTVYQTAEKLKKQGIISQLRKNNVAYFTPENPRQLLRLLDEKKALLNRAMPEIQGLMAREFDKPVTKLYIGKEGVKTLLDDIIETVKEKKIKQLHATSQPELLEYLPKFFPNWLKRREDLGVYTYLILPEAAENYLGSNDLREVRILPEKFPFNASVNISGSKIAFFAFQEGEPYGVSVESAAIANMFKQFFLFTWETLPRMNEKEKR